MDIWNILKAVLFGIVEGITEWLPISSTGHMILLDEFIKLNVSEAFLDMFLVVIQLGAILAVVVLYWVNCGLFVSERPDHQEENLQHVVQDRGGLHPGSHRGCAVRRRADSAFLQLYYGSDHADPVWYSFHYH